MRRLLRLCVNLFGLMISMTNQPSLMAEPIRGYNIHPANVPFVASIAMKSPGSVTNRDTFCSGSLIADNLVLTAAHCVEGYALNQLDVVFGAFDLRDAKPKYDVIIWLTFEQWATVYDPRMMRLKVNDIAILKLGRRVTGVKPANITTMEISDLYGKEANLIGWAREEFIPRFFRKAKVQILTPTACENRMQLLDNYVGLIREGMICTAANPFALNTRGDSGAPLLDDNNNILAVNHGFCPKNAFNCSEEFADERRINGHTAIIDEYRQFINHIKAIWVVEDIFHRLRNC